MRSALLAAMFVVGAAAAAACSTGTSGPPPQDEYDDYYSNIPVISVEAVDKLLAADACTPIDANGPRVRLRMGVLPGAVLLSDSEAFSLSELPTDKAKPLVFYCSNKYCTSSHEAANRAISAGYKDVKVMNAGIAGWVAARKQVDKR